MSAERRGRDCHDQRLPESARERARACRELDGYINQALISERNIARLEALAAAPDPALSEYAAALREIARIHPRRKRRWRRLAHDHPELLRRYLHAAGDGMADEIMAEMDLETRLWLDEGEEEDIPF